ncbi:LOW QUALITY PROTEIN: hypothetical protein QYF61_027521 [Mycteria americana]|uniref:Rna-directed dna polymerase from mobile element jockey-like n=1 Tax=Mycteria americana TaxID=33587 RepID=A0AAN7NNA5_MYCAM|nr:LOW QUALITY PROTEIN: hypothetical protein QYF61_027521 [Mycteria americana]
MPHGYAAIQDIDRLKKWADRSIVKFNKGKCKALHQGGITVWLESSSEEKDLGGHQRDHVPETCPALKKANIMLSCIRKSSVTSRWREGRSMKIIKGLEHLSSEEWLKRLELFSLEKSRRGGNLIYVYKCLGGSMSNTRTGFPERLVFSVLGDTKKPTRETCSSSLCFEQESCTKLSPKKPSNLNPSVIVWSCKDQI